MKVIEPALTSRSSRRAAACFCITTKQPILGCCTDAAGRFLVVAVGEAGEWDSFGRYSVFVVDLTDGSSAPMRLDLSIPVNPDGVGGERFVSMRVTGGKLLISRSERVQHWDGTLEQRPAPPMGFDLASGSRVANLSSSGVEASPEPPAASAEKFSWGSSQPQFAALAADLERVQGHRPVSLLAGCRIGAVSLVDYKVAEAHGVQHYLQVSIAGTPEAVLVPGVLETKGSIFPGSFEAHGQTAVYRPRAKTYLCAVPPSVSDANPLQRVYLPLEGAGLIPIDPPIAAWDSLPKAFLDLVKTDPPMRRIPLQYLAGRRTTQTRDASSAFPCGLWLMDDALIWRDALDSCVVLARQQVRGITTELDRNTQQWHVSVAREGGVPVPIAVEALAQFTERPDELGRVLTAWWQNLQPMKPTV